MLFNSLNFIVLFPLVFLLYYAIPAQYGKARNLFLLVVSYLLYLQWKPVWALVLMGVTVVTYGAALLLNRSKHPKAVLTVGILLALLLQFCQREHRHGPVAHGTGIGVAGIELGHPSGYLVFHVPGHGLPVGCLLQAL